MLPDWHEVNWIPLNSQKGKKIKRLAEENFLECLEDVSGYGGDEFLIDEKTLKCHCGEILTIYWNGREPNKGCFLPRQSRRHLKYCKPYQTRVEANSLRASIREMICGEDETR